MPLEMGDEYARFCRGGGMKATMTGLVELAAQSAAPEWLNVRDRGHGDGDGQASTRPSHWPGREERTLADSRPIFFGRVVGISADCVSDQFPWNPDTAGFRPSVLSAAAIKRAYRRQIVHDRA